MVDKIEAKLFNVLNCTDVTKYSGLDEEMVSYLTGLWSEEGDRNIIKKNKKKLDKMKKNINVDKFKKTLELISDNLIFRGNFGAYTDNLEKEMSLNKKSIIMDYNKTKELYLCLDDFIKYNQIRDELFDKIKFATIFTKYKKGDFSDPKSFRFLSNHSNTFKIIDKFWTNNLLAVLKRANKLPDINIVKNNFDREYTFSIRDLALEKLRSFRNGKKIVLIDIKKAFDSVSWNIIEDLLIKNLSRKINNNFAKKVVEQYLFLTKNRCLKFNNSEIRISKSIATGLPSSTIVFSLIIEQIIFEWFNLENCINEVSINTYVDDMYLEFKKTNNSLRLVESLIKYLKKYKLMVNQEKTKTNILSLPYSKINKSDCYLGMPFSENKKDYIEECIKMFNNKYYDINQNEIIMILKSEDYPKVKKEIIGFFNYKFYGLDEELNILSILINNN